MDKKNKYPALKNYKNSEMMESKTIEKLARELDYAKFEREQISLVLKETKSTLQKISMVLLIYFN